MNLGVKKEHLLYKMSDSDSSNGPLQKPNRGSRGRRGQPGPRVESCVIILKPDHTEYFIKNEADVVICEGATSFPIVWLPKIDSKMNFDCEYLTVNKTNSRVKIINLSDSPLRLKHHPDDRMVDERSVYSVKRGKYIIAYGVDNCWYLSK